MSKINTNLDSVKKAWQILNYPGKNIPTVLISGTNGKGSTAGFLWKLLSCLNLNIGLFISPHLKDISERIISNQDTFNKDRFDFYLNYINQKIPKKLHKKLSFFEINVLIALLYFQNINVNFIILEVGLGGRWDATNIVNPVISIITTIGYDHMDYLGNKLSDIFKEKLGIIRPGRPLFIGINEELFADNKSLNIFKKLCEFHKKVYFWNNNFGILNNLFFCDINKIYKNIIIPYNIHTNIDYKLYNFSLSFYVFLYIVNKMFGFTLQKYNICNILNKIQYIKPPAGLYARFDILNINFDGNIYKCVLDGAHNLSGIKVFLNNFKKLYPRPRLIFMSIMKDKDFNLMLSEASKLSTVVCFRNKSERSFDKKDIYDKNIDFFESFEILWDEWKFRIKDYKSTFGICGSLIAIGEILRFFDKFNRFK